MRVTGGAFAAGRLPENYYGMFIKAAQKGGMAAVCATEQYQERIAANPQTRDRLMAMDPKQYIKVMSNWRDQFIASTKTEVFGMTDADLASIAVPTVVIPGNDQTHASVNGRIAAQKIPGSVLHQLPIEDQEVPLINYAEWAPHEAEIAADLPGADAKGGFAAGPGADRRRPRKRTPARADTGAGNPLGSALMAGGGGGAPMLRALRSLLRAACALFALPADRARAAEQVDLLLVLAADVSRSIDQPQVPAAARGLCRGDRRPARARGDHRRPQQAHRGLPSSNGRASSSQKVVIDWSIDRRRRRGAQDSATSCVELPRSFAERTSISGGIDFAMALLARAPYRGAAPHHRRLRRRHQQFRPRRHARARRGGGQGRHHQRSGDPERPADGLESRAHQSARRARELLPRQRHRRPRRVRDGGARISTRSARRSSRS